MIRDDHDSFIDNPSTLYLQVKKAISDLASKEGVDIAHRACASALQPLIEKEIYLSRWKYSGSLETLRTKNKPDLQF